MLYPLKFKPVYKDYIWGGRNLEKLGKVLPDTIVAESWEITCHPDGMSVVANGDLKNKTLADLISEFGRLLLGNALTEMDAKRFPLLVKLIDANDKLSVQVHPADEYAKIHENGELGKNEMWHIISARPGAKLIYDVIPGTTRDSFAQAVRDGNIRSCLKEIEVFPGDTINIPAGLIHAIGEGIVLAEIQQNSNTTYRVYDYGRVDKNGNGRTLHIEKALDVIDFNTQTKKEKCVGLKVKLDHNSSKTYKIANRYFSVELYDIQGKIDENADGSRFFIYTFIEGTGILSYYSDTIGVTAGESVLIPASLGNYSLEGTFKALKAYVPDIIQDVIDPLKSKGYTEQEVYENISGLTQK